MHQLPLRLTGDRPQSQFRFRFPRAVASLPPKNPWLAAGVLDFRHSTDGRKWKARCWLKRQICRGYSKLGYAATEEELHRFLKDEKNLPIPRRTIRWGIRILKAQGFLSNVRRLRNPGSATAWNGPMLRELHPSQLGKPYIPYGTPEGLRHSFAPSFYPYRMAAGPKNVRRSFASDRESCRPTPRESCRVNSPKSAVGRPGGFRVGQARSLPQELGAGLRRRSSRDFSGWNPTRKALTPQQDRWRRVQIFSRLVDELRAGRMEEGEIEETVKCWAAQRGMPYDDTPAGCNSPIAQAITIADVRAGSPRFAPFGSRRRR